MASQGIRWNNNVNSRTMQKSSFWAVSCAPCIQSCKRSGIASSLPCNIWSLSLVKHANPWNVSYNCRDGDKMEAYAAERFEFMAWRLKSFAFRGIVSCTWTGGLKVLPVHASFTEGSRRQSRRNIKKLLKSPKFTRNVKMFFKTCISTMQFWTILAHALMAALLPPLSSTFETSLAQKLKL